MGTPPLFVTKLIKALRSHQPSTHGAERQVGAATPASSWGYLIVLMLLHVSTVTAICVLIELSDSASTEQELEELFRTRSNEDWEQAWHQERHARCQERLLRHLYWACEKDIYRLHRRNSQDEEDQVPAEDDSRWPFLSVVEAQVFLRERRGVRRRRAPTSSITDECCMRNTGCTWEEYAEYCPSNKRYRKFV